MTSAIVQVFDSKQSLLKGRMLLDTCATANFISEEFLKKLNVPKKKFHISVSALNDMITSAKYYVNITFKSLYNEYTKSLNFFVIPSITDTVPSSHIPINDLNIPKNLLMADPYFYKPSKVDMLIGAGPTLSLFSLGQINLSCRDFDLILQKTKLGWIIGGGVNPFKNSNNHASSCLTSDLQFDIAKFWSIEELPKKSNFSLEELDCEEHFKKHVKRDKYGRYIVALPFKTNSKGLGESRSRALKRLQSLQKRFKFQKELRKQYVDVINEYLRLGHMSLIKHPCDKSGFYLSHHAVIKNSSDTTKVRVVFDGSAESSNGTSLNECLMVGPTIQDDLFSLLIRFRTYKYVLLADIEKMYRQFLVREEDRDFQKILWYDEGTLYEYRLNTLTFGLGPSSFLAIRCLWQLVEDEGHKFPLASKILKNDMYVDNMITGSNSKAEAREIYFQITNLLKCACLNMRQWASNDITILNGVSVEQLDNKFNLSKDCTLKTLGVFWKANEDVFIFDVKTPLIQKQTTKRVIFSEIAKIFDPLGLIGPVILHAKLIIQDL